MARFEDLSDDILYIVLKHLWFERSFSLRFLRLISVRFNSFAESVLYRNIVLQDDHHHESASYHFIERLTNPNDTMRQQVRSIQIKSFKGNEKSYCMNTTFFLACLNNIDRLKLFSWDSDVALPNELLGLLHGRFPEAQVCATIKTLKQPLLNWPQLYRLDVSLPLLNSNPATCSSLCTQLRDILLQCRSLRDLSIDAHHNPTAQAVPEQYKQSTKLLAIKKNGLWRGSGSAMSMSSGSVSSSIASSRRTDEPENVDTLLSTIELPLGPNHQLPPLEHLHIRAPTYNLEMGHCRQLLEGLDWKNLKHLKLAPSDPTSFFATFSGRLPRLERLEFTYPDGRPNYFPSTSIRPRFYACSQFIASIPTLKELLIRCDAIESDDPLWTTLANVHGAHLRCLSIQANHDGLEAPVWKGHATALLSCFSSLTTLDLNLRLCSPLTYNSSGCSLCHSRRPSSGTSHIYSIPVIASLKSFRVSVRINTYERALFSHVIDYAHSATKTIWTDYLNNLHDSRLENLTIVFWRWELKSPHPDENGLPRNTHVNAITIDSRLVGTRLIVRPRNQLKDRTKYYDMVWQETRDGRQAIFVEGEADSPSQTSAGR